MNQGVNLAKQLDRIRRFLAPASPELELYEFSAAGGYASVGKVLNSWIGYPKIVARLSIPTTEGRYLEITISPTATVTGTSLIAMLAQPTHVRIGSLYYKIRGAPEYPVETLGAVAYWTIRCDPTGQEV